MENSAPSLAPSTIWHIVWQAVEGRDLVASDELVEQIRARLLATHRPAGRELLHYLLTPTEMHLLSRLPAGTPPRDVVRSIGSIVARWVRQTQGRPGVVFAGPYRAYAVESEQAARDEFRMLAWRPVILGLCKIPMHHVTSSLRTTLGKRRPAGFELMKPLLMFGNGRLPAARDVFKAAIATRPSEIEVRRWELARGMTLAPGDAGMVSSVARPVRGLAAALVAASEPPGIDGALMLLERWVLVRIGLRDVESLAMSHSLAGARVHALVASLAVQLELCSAASVARHYRRAKATLSERMAACRREPEDRAILGLPLGRIVEEAIGLRPPEPPSESGGAAVHGPLSSDGRAA
jgi:hypothetical protein